MVASLMGVFNLDAETSALLTMTAIREVSPNQGSTISLDNLDTHGVIEHDASMTRLDKKQGDNVNLNPELFARLLNTTVGDSMSASDLAIVRANRAKQSVAAGSPKLDTKFSAIAAGETALLVNTFGKIDASGQLSVPKSYIKSLFSEEQLPSNLGWTKPTLTQSLNGTVNTANSISAAINQAGGNYFGATLHSTKMSASQMQQTLRFYTFLAIKEFLYVNKGFVGEMLDKNKTAPAGYTEGIGTQDAIPGSEADGFLTPKLAPDSTTDTIVPQPGASVAVLPSAAAAPAAAGSSDSSDMSSMSSMDGSAAGSSESSDASAPIASASAGSADSSDMSSMGGMS
jgi:Peroxidase, family 2